MTRKSRQELEELFAACGIDFSAPGFYDSPEFKEVEKERPAFIASYAEYIDTLEFPAGYVEMARTVTIEAADFLFRELVRDGRIGACIDASGALQRFLERQGVWSYLAGGGVRIHFPAASRVTGRFFWPLVDPENPAQTGHAWLCAPPFKVVDITLPVQGYPPDIAKHFGRFVAVERSVPAKVEAGDLYDNKLIEFHVRKHGSRPTLDDLAHPQREFMLDFPAFQVAYLELELKYIPMHISAMDGDLDAMRNLCLSGNYPTQLYAAYLSERRD